MPTLPELETEADALLSRLATVRSEISQRRIDLCDNLQAEVDGLMSQREKLNDDLAAANQRAQSAEERAKAALKRAKTAEEQGQKSNDHLEAAALERALTAEGRAESLKNDLGIALKRAENLNNDLGAALERAETAEFHARERDQRVETRLQVLHAQVVDVQREIRDERENRQVAEDKLYLVELELEAERSRSGRAERRHAGTAGSDSMGSAQPSSSHEPASESEDCKSEHWQRRITELVQAHPKGLPLHSVYWAWTQKYPDESPKKFQPVTKLKSAIQRVDGVYVDNASDKVHLQRGRSRSPRRSTAQEAKAESTTDHTDSCSALADFTETVRDRVEKTLDAKLGANRSVPVENIIGTYAKRSWQLDPTLHAKALDEWKESIKPCDIDALLQTHVPVNDKFSHGHHAGTSVAKLVRELTNGTVSPVTLPPLVVVSHESKLWVVFGNRRLRALKEALPALTESGWPRYVKCIVHHFGGPEGLGDKQLPLFCKLLDDMSAKSTTTVHQAFPWRQRQAMP